MPNIYKTSHIYSEWDADDMCGGCEGPKWSRVIVTLTKGPTQNEYRSAPRCDFCKETHNGS